MLLRLVAGLLLATVVSWAVEKPNLVFIMADDMGYGDVGCYNRDSLIPTPNIDRLAREGIRFTDAHSPSAVCTPTRYGVLTGRYCWRTSLKRGVLLGYSRALIEPDRLTVAQVLRDQGYATACVGKWHLGMNWQLKPGQKLTDPLNHRDGSVIDFTKPASGGPLDVGFDYFFGVSACATTDYLYSYIEGRQTVGIPSVPWPAQRVPPEWRHLHDIAYRPGMATPGWKHETVDIEFTRKAVNWIEGRAAEPDKPFFLYFPLSSPHAPWLPPAIMRGRSKEGDRGDMVTVVDWAVGRVLDTLDRLGLADNTLVVVTSDNGPRVGLNGHRSSGPWRGYKSHTWEGGHRVPFIARWPGHTAPGSASDEPISLADWMATVAALVGAELPDTDAEDSYNVLPALLGQKLDRPIREAIVSHSVYGAFSIRCGDWKLILGTKDSGGWVPPRDPTSTMDYSIGQLYNLTDDPEERTDLFDKRPEVVSELRELLQRYQREGRSN